MPSRILKTLLICGDPGLGANNRVCENNSARILHAAKTCSTDYQSEFFIWIRRDGLTEKLQGRLCRSKSLHCEFLISLRNVISEPGYFLGCRLYSGKVSDSDDHAVGWNRNCFDPGPGTSRLRCGDDLIKFPIGVSRAGAVTEKVTVAFAEGWSRQGIQ